MRITLVNKLSEETNLHFHGLHVSPSGAADNVFIHVEPGHSFTYVVHIPSDEPTGLYWYHSHMHRLSEEQVFGGLSGMLVVDGITRLLPKPLRGITHRELALRDLQVKNGAISQAQNPNERSLRFVNSLLDPALTIRPGETQLWSIANIGANTFYK